MKAWLARCKNGLLYLCTDKPFRYKFGWLSAYDSIELSENDVVTELATKVTWEGEPIQVEITIKEVGNETRTAKED